MIAFLIALLVFANLAPPDEVTVEELQDAYAHIFSIEARHYGGDVLIDLDVEALPSDHPLAGLVNKHRHFLLYLVQHGTGFRAAELSGLSGDSLALSESFVEALRQDQPFNRLFLPVAARHLRSRGDTLVGYETKPRRTVPFERALDVAVRFFYPSTIQDGRIVTYACVGINGLEDLEGGRDLLLEAFAYAAIFRDLLAPQHHVEADFDRATKLVNEMNLSTDRAKRLTRAQGVMWAKMRESEALRSVLRDGYVAMEHFLPFEIEREP